MPKRLPPLTETCRACGGALSRNGGKPEAPLGKCKDCGLVQRLDPGPLGRPPLGDRPMTSAERSRRHRANRKA